MFLRSILQQTRKKTHSTWVCVTWGSEGVLVSHAWLSLKKCCRDFARVQLVRLAFSRAGPGVWILFSDHWKCSVSTTPSTHNQTNVSYVLSCTTVAYVSSVTQEHQKIRILPSLITKIAMPGPILYYIHPLLSILEPFWHPFGTLVCNTCVTRV